MALIGSTTGDIGDTANVTSRKRRKSSVGVKRQNEFSRDFTSFSSGGSGCSGDYNPTATTTTIMSTNSDNYTTVISSLYSASSGNGTGGSGGGGCISSQTTSPLKFQDRGQNVSMKIQFQITTSPDMGMLPPTPTVASSLQQKDSPLLMKHRSNSAMVPSSQTTTTLDQQHNDEDTIAARRHQLQILHQQKIETDERQQTQNNQVSNGSFKREHRRRPSTTIGVNLDSKGSVTNHHNIAAISQQCQSEDSAKDKIASLQATTIQANSPSGLTARSATFGSFSGSETNSHHSDDCLKESIYFKRDGQRFNHEFTLKLSVDRTYRCLLKIKPSIPLQSISIQGHHIRFHDCTLTSQQSKLNKFVTTTIQSHYQQQQANNNINNNNNAETATNQQQKLASLKSVDHHQPISPIHHLTKHFLHTHSHTHNSGQLIYVFDWSASRFEVNKNKARTEVQMVLKFKNGETLMLPLQVKFYYSDCRQHLNWGKYPSYFLGALLITLIVLIILIILIIVIR